MAGIPAGAASIGRARPAGGDRTRDRRSARDGDVVVIAGKGHETYQEVDGEVVPFDDREVARAAIAARGDRR